MKIALFTNILNPYRSSFFEKMKEECVHNGNEFRVYAMTGEKSDRPWKYEDFKRDYTRLLKSKTIKISGIYLHYNPSIRKEIAEYRPDVVVMAGSYLQPTVLKLSRLKRKYGYATFFWSESHFNEQRSYNQLLLKIRERIRTITLKRMDGFWYPGTKAKEFVDRYKSDNAILIQVPNTVEDSFFSGNVNDISMKRTHEPKVLFTAARLHPAKGFLEFFEILKGVNPQKYKWIIAGDGELHDKMQSLIKQYNLNVKLLGDKSPQEVKELYKEADLFILPSISDANPLTCVEALWSGLPLFLSDNVGNSSEVIIHNINGYVFRYEDANEAHRMLVSMLEKEDDWYSKARKASYCLAVSNFKQEIVAKRTLAMTISAIRKEDIDV